MEVVKKWEFKYNNLEKTKEDYKWNRHFIWE